MKFNSQVLLEFLRRRGVCSAKEVCEHFDVSQPTVSRAMKELRSDIISIGFGRRTRYAALKKADLVSLSFPLYRVNNVGHIEELGRLFSIYNGFYLESKNGFNSLCGGEFLDGVFESLPWFLYEMRPQGYIGRQIISSVSELYGFSSDLDRWTDLQILHYLSHSEMDLPGALIIGEIAREKFLSKRFDWVSEFERAEKYPFFAEKAASVKMISSSAAGEQPKFSCAIERADLSKKFVFVKFSGDLGVPIERRRADLLVAEKIASDILGEYGFPVPKTDIIFGGNRCFLESERIDRVGEFGRKWTCSLSSIDAALIGSDARSWTSAVSQGVRVGVFSEECLKKVKILDNFGEAIGNDDRHFGNLSFEISPEYPFELAPIYDMTPMQYRVRMDSSFAQEPIFNHPSDALSKEMAEYFWKKISGDERISEEFRKIARKLLTQL